LSLIFLQPTRSFVASVVSPPPVKAGVPSTFPPHPAQPASWIGLSPNPTSPRPSTAGGASSSPALHRAPPPLPRKHPHNHSIRRHQTTPMGPFNRTKCSAR